MLSDHSSLSRTNFISIKSYVVALLRKTIPDGLTEVPGRNPLQNNLSFYYVHHVANVAQPTRTQVAVSSWKDSL